MLRQTGRMSPKVASSVQRLKMVCRPGLSLSALNSRHRQIVVLLARNAPSTSRASVSSSRASDCLPRQTMRHSRSAGAVLMDDFRHDAHVGVWLPGVLFNHELEVGKAGRRTRAKATLEHVA